MRADRNYARELKSFSPPSDLQFGILANLWEAQRSLAEHIEGFANEIEQLILNNGLTLSDEDLRSSLMKATTMSGNSNVNDVIGNLLGIPIDGSKNRFNSSTKSSSSSLRNSRKLNNLGKNSNVSNYGKNQYQDNSRNIGTNFQVNKTQSGNDLTSQTNYQSPMPSPLTTTSTSLSQNNVTADSSATVVTQKKTQSFSSSFGKFLGVAKRRVAGTGTNKTTSSDSVNNNNSENHSNTNVTVNSSNSVTNSNQYTASKSNQTQDLKYGDEAKIDDEANMSMIIDGDDTLNGSSDVVASYNNYHGNSVDNQVHNDIKTKGLSEPKSKKSSKTKNQSDTSQCLQLPQTSKILQYCHLTENTLTDLDHSIDSSRAAHQECLLSWIAYQQTFTKDYYSQSSQGSASGGSNGYQYQCQNQNGTGTAQTTLITREAKTALLKRKLIALREGISISNNQNAVQDQPGPTKTSLDAATLPEFDDNEIPIDLECLAFQDVTRMDLQETASTTEGQKNPNSNSTSSQVTSAGVLQTNTNSLIQRSDSKNSNGPESSSSTLIPRPSDLWQAEQLYRKKVNLITQIQKRTNLQLESAISDMQELESWRDQMIIRVVSEFTRKQHDNQMAIQNLTEDMLRGVGGSAIAKLTGINSSTQVNANNHNVINNTSSFSEPQLHSTGSLGSGPGSCDSPEMTMSNQIQHCQQGDSEVQDKNTVTNTIIQIRKPPALIEIEKLCSRDPREPKTTLSYGRPVGPLSMGNSFHNATTHSQNLKIENNSNESQLNDSNLKENPKPQTSSSVTVLDQDLKDQPLLKALKQLIRSEVPQSSLVIYSGHLERLGRRNPSLPANVLLNPKIWRQCWAILTIDGYFHGFEKNSTNLNSNSNTVTSSQFQSESVSPPTSPTRSGSYSAGFTLFMPECSFSRSQSEDEKDRDQFTIEAPCQKLGGLVKSMKSTVFRSKGNCDKWEGVLQNSIGKNYVNLDLTLSNLDQYSNPSIVNQDLCAYNTSMSNNDISIIESDFNNYESGTGAGDDPSQIAGPGSEIEIPKLDDHYGDYRTFESDKDQQYTEESHDIDNEKQANSEIDADADNDDDVAVQADPAPEIQAVTVTAGPKSDEIQADETVAQAPIDIISDAVNSNTVSESQTQQVVNEFKSESNTDVLVDSESDPAPFSELTVDKEAQEPNIASNVDSDLSLNTKSEISDSGSKKKKKKATASQKLQVITTNEVDTISSSSTATPILETPEI